MRRRDFFKTGLGLAMTSSLSAAWKEDRLQSADTILSSAVEEKRVHAASLLVRQGAHTWARHFGAADSVDSIFLLASISKPISVAALMTLFDQGMFQLEDRVSHEFVDCLRIVL